MFCLLKYKFLPFFLFLVAIFECLSINDHSAASSLPENPELISWHISARAVTFDNKRDLYIAEDDVIITGGKTRLEADYIEFSNKTKDAFARGNVLLISGEDYISCNSMDINLATQMGTITKGTIFIQKNNFYINGENIKKLGKFTYSADKGSITSCSGDSPDWKISARDIKVTVEGYGTARDTVLWAKNIPTAYSPFLLFPAQTKRQTGFLIPRVSRSDRKGFEYEQPLFFALSRNTDASIYADYMSERGTKIGAEFRYVLDNKTKGSMFFDFLEDDKIDDGTFKTEDYSFSTTPQRTNRDRYWFRMKHSQELDNGFTAKLDIDIVSDEDYLQEFKEGFTGYDETKEYFDREFGRGLDEYDDNIRQNWLNINKSWDSYSFNFDAFWYDNITARRQNIADTTLQTLPSLQFDAIKQQIGPSNLFYSLDSEFTSFYREDNTTTLVRGSRIDFYPKVYLPLKLGRFLHFEPFAGSRSTIWRTNNFIDINGDSSNVRTRQLYDVGALVSTKLINIFNSNNRFADKIKHEMIPELEYAFTPVHNQDDLPAFDELDRIEEQNRLTWSLTNTFISKKSRLSPKGKKITDYHNFAYIKVYQSYNIQKERDNATRPFSDITLETEFSPNKFIYNDLDVSWSPYENHIKTLNIRNILKDNRGDSLRTEYRYTSSVSESLYSKIDVKLTNELSAYASIEKNLDGNKTLETRAGISIKKSCWTVNLFFAESSNEQSVTFLINLHGIGEFGTR